MIKRMSLVMVIFAVILLSSAGIMRCDATELHDRVESFFKQVNDGKVSEAVDFIYSDNPWMNRAADAIQNIKTQMLNLDQIVGKYCAHKKLIEKVVAERFIYISYFVAYERQPLRFEFEFYKPKDKWMIYSFSFDDKIDLEVEESARLSTAL